MGIIAVLLTFVLAIIAARATGETDFTPIGAMGKITQLTYGLLAPSNTTINLSTASITGAGACHSADLLVSMKAGYLVGANPRRQALSQFFGVIAGVLVCIPVYQIIVRMPAFDPAAEKSLLPRRPTKSQKTAAKATNGGIEDGRRDEDQSLHGRVSRPLGRDLEKRRRAFVARVFQASTL